MYELDSDWLFVSVHARPVMDWWHIQGVPRLRLERCWDGLQHPRDLVDKMVQKMNE